MAMGTERSKALHNFTMPGDLRWGNQKFFRCMRVNSNGQIPADNHRGNSDPSDQRRSVSPELGRYPSSSGGGRRRKVEAEKAMAFDLQSAAAAAAEEGNKRESILKDGLAEDGERAAPPPPPPPSTVPSDVRPWNLRTRRASVKFSGGLGGGSASLAVEGGGAGNRNNNTASLAAKFPLTGNIGDVGASGEKRERRKFSVPLSKKEIEEDFFAFVGHRPPRRPKKRARNVQKQMDTLFPGLWLTEVTPDMYKVAEAAAP